MRRPPAILYLDRRPRCAVKVTAKSSRGAEDVQLLVVAGQCMCPRLMFLPFSHGVAHTACAAYITRTKLTYWPSQRAPEVNTVAPAQILRFIQWHQSELTVPASLLPIASQKFAAGCEYTHPCCGI